MRKQKGFTLIELLIVVAIIGIIAAIAIPNLLDAIERSRQKRTIGDLRNLAGAIQTFSTDNGGYPGPLAAGDASAIQGISSSTFTPDYIQAIPAADGWKGIYTYLTGACIVNRPTNNTPLVVACNFALYSLGSDGAAGSPTPTIGGVAATGVNPDATIPLAGAVASTGCYQADIVFVNTAFVQAPDGKQKKC